MPKQNQRVQPTHGITFDRKDQALDFLEFLEKEFDDKIPETLAFEIRSTMNMKEYLMFFHIDDSLVGDVILVKVEQLYNKFKETEWGKTPTSPLVDRKE